MILQSHRALQARPKDSNTVKRSSVVTKVHIHALVLTEPGRRCGRARLCRSAGGGRPDGLGAPARGSVGLCGGPSGASGGKRPFLGLPSRSEPAIDRASGSCWLPGGRPRSEAPASRPGSARQSIFTFRYNFSTRPKRPVSEPKFGFVAFAETWNGRLAMMGFIIGLGTELLTGQGILSQIGLG